MTLQREIDDAIGAHAAWKMRLRSAIDRRDCDYQVYSVRLNDQCQFGKWLFGCPAGVKASAGYENIWRLHTQFHRIVGNVLDLAVRGNREEAERSIAKDSPFDRTSRALTVALTSWEVRTR